LTFKALHQDITYDWQTIRSKVLNERMAHNKRRKMCINKMRLWIIGHRGTYGGINMAEKGNKDETSYSDGCFNWRFNVWNLCDITLSRHVGRRHLMIYVWLSLVFDAILVRFAIIIKIALALCHQLCSNFVYAVSNSWAWIFRDSCKLQNSLKKDKKRFEALQNECCRVFWLHVKCFEGQEVRVLMVY